MKAADARFTLGFILTTIPFNAERCKQAYAMLDAELAKGTSPRDALQKIAEVRRRKGDTIIGRAPKPTDTPPRRCPPWRLGAFSIWAKFLLPPRPKISTATPPRYFYCHPAPLERMTMLSKPERHAATLAAFIIDDLRLRLGKDWPLVADLIAQRLRGAAAADAMRGMLNPSPAFYARRTALIPNTNARRGEAERETCQGESRA